VVDTERVLVLQMLLKQEVQVEVVEVIRLQ
jgi:hypothetical protein